MAPAVIESKLGMKRVGSVGSNKDYNLSEDGEKDSHTYRLQAVDGGEGETKKISLWHDVSLMHLDPESREPTGHLNFVCEISKFSRYVLHLFLQA